MVKGYANLFFWTAYLLDIGILDENLRIYDARDSIKMYIVALQKEVGWPNVDVPTEATDFLIKMLKKYQPLD